MSSYLAGYGVADESVQHAIVDGPQEPAPDRQWFQFSAVCGELTNMPYWMEEFTDAFPMFDPARKETCPRCLLQVSLTEVSK